MTDQMQVAAGSGDRREAERLYREVTALRAEVAARAQETLGQWRIGADRERFRDSAANLAAWLALRQIDLGELQLSLAALGLSSLGRCEAHVLASIDAVLASLAVLAGASGPEHPPVSIFAASRTTLAARRDALFGDMRDDSPSTRIMVTLPAEAAEDRGLVAELLTAGADCLRINTTHDGPDDWARMAAHIASAAQAAGRRAPVLMDLGGPKLRIKAVSSREKIRFHPGDRFALAPALSGQREEQRLFTATLSHPEILASLADGDAVWIDDGVLRARVVARQGAICELEVVYAKAKGGRIKPDKGVNLPGRTLKTPALTQTDREHLDTVLEHADIIGLSFVQTVEDVRELLAELESRAAGRPLPPILLKIETPQAVANLPWLIVEAGARAPVAVMIARGDLAVEIGLDRLSEIQEEILWLCEAARTPVVWATQVLEGLVKTGLASRAEATDAAMAQRADCVMLNKGPHILEGVRFLRDVLRRMDRHHHKKTPRLGRLNAWTPQSPPASQTLGPAS